MKINLISLYGPNKDEPNFFDEIKQLALIEDSHYVLICGDLNLVLNPAQNCYNYVGINNPKSRLKMVEMLQELGLCDVYRWFHPNERKYTWTRKTPLKKSRLDYFLATTQMTDVITDCNIKSSYRSDHSIIELKICLSKFNHGKGVWKMNNTLLKNKDYLDLINKVITEEKFKYALPIYSCEYINTNYDIQLTIESDLFLEVLVMRIRGKTIKFGSYLKKQQNTMESNLIKDINELENMPNLDNSQLLEDKKTELENLRKEKLKGSLVRSRMQWLSEGEKPSSFFGKLESKSYIDKTIKKPELCDGTITNDQCKILEEVKNYYAKLFGENEQKPRKTIGDLIDVSKINKFPCLNFGDEITLSELSTALKNMKSNKTPGIDGISSEFLKVFWSKMKYFIKNAINACYKKGKLSTSLWQVIIICLPKDNKDRKYIKNWRLISLLSVRWYFFRISQSILE